MIAGSYSSDNVGSPDPVTALSICHEVTVRPRNPIDYNIYGGDKIGFVRRTGGESFTFRGVFDSGAIVGYTETLSGTETFDKVCV